MSDDAPFDFTAYREGTGQVVPCGHCQRPIPADAVRCPECGVHFRGRAADFAPDAHLGAKPLKRWVRITVWVVVAAAAALALLWLLGS